MDSTTSTSGVAVPLKTLSRIPYLLSVGSDLCIDLEDLGAVVVHVHAMTYVPRSEVTVQLSYTTPRAEIDRLTAALLTDVTASDPEDEDRVGKDDDNRYRWGVYAATRVEVFGGSR